MLRTALLVLFAAATAGVLVVTAAPSARSATINVDCAGDSLQGAIDDRVALVMC